MKWWRVLQIPWEQSRSTQGVKLTKAQSAAGAHDTDFEIPLYTVWKPQEKTAGSPHFGDSEVRSP